MDNFLAYLQELIPGRPPHLDGVFWLALALVLAGATGELIFRYLQVPRIVGYALVGAIVANSGFGVSAAELNYSLKVAIDIAFAVLLFELGSRVNLGWLRANPWLIATSLVESTLTFVGVGGLLIFVGMPIESSLLVAAIAVSTAPAVTMRVTAEFRAHGQVTERLLLFSALNSIYAVLAVKVVQAWLNYDTRGDFLLVGFLLYEVIGSLLVAALLAWAVRAVERRFAIHDEHLSLLLLGLLLLTLSIVRLLHLSVLLVPLLAGIQLRRSDARPRAWPRHFGTAGGVLVIVLFVVTGMATNWHLVLTGGLIALALLGVRLLAKLLPPLIFARPSGLSWKQGVATGLALVPMSDLAFALTADLAVLHPHLGVSLGAIVVSAIAVLEFFGPLIQVAALRWTRETQEQDAPVVRPPVMQQQQQ